MVSSGLKNVILYNNIVCSSYVVYFLFCSIMCGRQNGTIETMADGRAVMYSS